MPVVVDWDGFEPHHTLGCHSCYADIDRVRYLDYNLIIILPNDLLNATPKLTVLYDMHSGLLYSVPSLFFVAKTMCS